MSKYKNHEEDYTCAICSKPDSAEYALESEIKKHHGYESLHIEKRACKPCWLLFQNFTSDLRRHERFNTPFPELPPSMPMRRYILGRPELRQVVLEKLKTGENVVKFPGVFLNKTEE